MDRNRVNEKNFLLSLFLSFSNKKPTTYQALLQATHPSFVQQTAEDRSTFRQVLLGRALAFYELEFYEEFLQDCDALFHYCELDDVQRQDLNTKRTFCRSKLDEALANLESDLKLNLNKMKANYVESSQLYGMSEKIETTYDPKTGRGLQANCKLNENELISIQRPFVSVLAPSRYKQNCFHCLIKLSKFGGFWPCRQCTQVRFCSFECEEAAWTESHRHECTYLDLLNYSNTFHFQPRLALRLVLKHGVENVLETFGKRCGVATSETSQSKNKRANRKKQAANGKAASKEPDFSSMNYEAICSLQDHADQTPDFSPPVTLMLLFLVQKFRQLTDPQITVLGCVLLKHLQQIHTNSKFILSKELKAETSNKHSDLLLLSDVKIGCALFTTFSLINHSCSPNVITFHFTGNCLYLKTLCEIAAGEQINISYGTNCNWHSVQERAEFLSKFYFFSCECKSCAAGLQPVCQALKCEKCKDAPVHPIKHSKYDSKCQVCKTMFVGRFEAAKKQTQGSVDLLDKINLLFSKGDETDFKKLKIILNDIRSKFEKVFYKHNSKLQLVEQQLSICCKLLGENEESVQHSERALEILGYELNEHYSGNFNALIKLIDRQVILFRACSDNPKNLDHLKLDYLKNLKKGGFW